MTQNSLTYWQAAEAYAKQVLKMDYSAVEQKLAATLAKQRSAMRNAAFLERYGTSPKQIANSFSVMPSELARMEKEARKQLAKEQGRGITLTPPPPARSYLSLCIKVALNAKQVRA